MSSSLEKHTLFEPQDPNYRIRVENSFARQRAMATLKITLARLEPGEIELTFPYQEELTQQHGFIHAGILATALDSACGYAAFSLMPPEAAVLTVEFKTNLLAPAQGDFFRVVGRVVKPGSDYYGMPGGGFRLSSEPIKASGHHDGHIDGAH